MRLIVVGAGRLGGFHAQKIRKLESELDLELVGLVDPSEPQRVMACEALNCRGFDNLYDGVLDNVDAAIVAAPTPLHYQLGKTLLERGKHVLMEKPVTLASSEADELNRIARKTGAVLQVGHVERFNPAFVQALDGLDTPEFITANRSSGFTFRSTDVGVVHDLMIHDLDLVIAAVNSPIDNIEAIGKTLVSGHEDIAFARLWFANGCIAELEASRVSRKAVRTMTIQTESQLCEIDFATRSVTKTHWDQQLVDGTFNVNNLSKDELEYYRTRLMDQLLPQQCATYDTVDALELEMRDFVDSIRTVRQPRVTGQAGQKAVAAAEWILKSIAQNTSHPQIIKLDRFRKVG